jgi:hypothetical protein
MAGRYPGSLCPADAGDLRRQDASLNLNGIERRAARASALWLSLPSCSYGVRQPDGCDGGR